MGLMIALTLLSQSETPSTQTATVQSKTAQMQFGGQDPLRDRAQFSLGTSIAALQARVDQAIAGYPDGQVGLLVVDLDTGDFVDRNSLRSFSAASTIKLPILAAFYQAVDQGAVSLNESLVMTADLVAGEAGTMQYSPVGTQFSALETVTKMITISDNTATNMIIARLGDYETLNRRFQTWGLRQTKVQQWLPDLGGTNEVSPMDLVNLLIRLEQGELVSRRSRDRIFNTLTAVQNRQLLPQGLDEGAIIAHKTGTLGGVLADVGLVDVPNGKRYAIAVITERPRNDPQAQTLIQTLSRLTYQYFSSL
jgi:beta-lactamase class A